MSLIAIWAVVPLAVVLRPSSPIVAAQRQLEATLERCTADLQRMAARLRPGSAGEDAGEAAALVGTWTKAGSENMDEFLDKALGVGYLKRRVAIKAGQTQRITVRGGVVQLEITDRRGTKKHEMHPGRTMAGKGFIGLPVHRHVSWGRDGTLIMTERYSQHLGGDEAGSPCKGDECPLVRSQRGVRKGMMFVEVERELLTGGKVRMKTLYRRKE